MQSRLVPLSGSLLVALALVSVAATTAAAQDHPHGHGMHQHMHGHPMMMAMMDGPHLALREREQLGLSADQVRRLEAVQEGLREAHHAPMERMREIHQELSAAMNEELDEARARAALQRMAEVHTEMGLAMLRARQETRVILTSEQRERLAELGHEHMEHMRHMMERGEGMPPGMMGPGMMMECPLMQHGGERERHRHDH
jgi:Spy/CpxP family protein refolding chaperone